MSLALLAWRGQQQWNQRLKLPEWHLCSAGLFSSTCVPLADKDLFGAEPFDPFTCGAADFPPDIQSKLDEMQVSPRLIPPPPAPLSRRLWSGSGALEHPGAAVCSCQCSCFEHLDVFLSCNEQCFSWLLGETSEVAAPAEYCLASVVTSGPISYTPQRVAINQADVAAISSCPPVGSKPA